MFHVCMLLLEQAIGQVKLGKATLSELAAVCQLQSCVKNMLLLLSMLLELGFCGMPVLCFCCPAGFTEAIDPESLLASSPCSSTDQWQLLPCDKQTFVLIINAFGCRA